MNYTLVVIFSFSIAIPAIIGWIRVNKINPAYYPFLFSIWLALLNETTSYFLIRNGYSNAVNNNLYVLAESLLITWQFKNWNLFGRYRYVFIITIISFILSWLTESIFIKGINSPISYFRIFYSFVIALFSVSMINRQITIERKNILKNSIFLICIAYVIYYTYTVILGAFWLYGLNLSQQFMMNLTAILFYVNLLINLIYALAILWMPIKHRFSLPS